MTIAITGATGHLGRLVVESLLARGADAGDLVAVVRDPGKAADLAAKGVQVRAADYTDRAALESALAGVDKLLLISSSEVGQRLPQHTNVIEAAKTAGVAFVAYTSVLDAANSALTLAQEHKATEEVMAASGIEHALLRNGWYWENYTTDLAGTIERGVLAGAAGDGRVAAAARADYAEAAAVVLLADGQAGKVYELGGDERLTLAELAAKISDAAGKTVVYQDLSEDQFGAVLESAGLPAVYAGMLANSDAGIKAGALDTTSGDLQTLIGRSSTPVAEVLRRSAPVRG
ncbi:NAD(P)H dehydrogenase (quinone) [Rhodococcus sp. OK611]|uniref:SDR family oxidoreductase n=1 Tax=unclassified Rhodococcus (in: high G+C Gram-positive bacteria) TaxID=192944 RepID=UPI000BCF890F|nr:MULTISPECIES: SDR family oxidoreductase [unclassified Rhodococcus (in: high G+C Gram-positive bacteria)]PTR45099.1 NAD(P)H dehydrogenase (quinone) [Rhodococcus sp. OK611]SNX89434.1 NAD(P)H dehydrogenase (quinone) [Rhodococcus sp. OK270]